MKVFKVLIKISMHSHRKHSSLLSVRPQSYLQVQCRLNETSFRIRRIQPTRSRHFSVRIQSGIFLQNIHLLTRPVHRSPRLTLFFYKNQENFVDSEMFLFFLEFEAQTVLILFLFAVRFQPHCSFNK